MTDTQDNFRQQRPLRNSRPPIFNELRLRNFKSISEATIPLHGLTVVVGANSAGKSTLLQALLVLAQAGRTELSSARLPLNGEFVQLGEFQEVQTFGVDSSHGITIGLSASVSPSRPRSRPAISENPDDLATLTWNGHFAEPDDPYSGYANLQAIELAMHDASGSPLFSLDIASVVEDVESIEEARFDDPVGFARGPRIKVDGRWTNFREHETRSINSARFFGGIPGQLYGEYTAARLISRIWWDVWTASGRSDWELLREQHRRQTGPFEAPLSARKRSASIDQASKLIRGSKEIQVLLSEEREVPPNLHRVLRDLFSDFKSSCTSTVQKSVLISMMHMGEARFYADLKESLEDLSWTGKTLSLDIRNNQGDASWELGFYFRSYLRGLKYLGPIREAPRALYDPSPSRNDIGVRGEYAAAVLNAQARELVKCPLPGGGQAAMPLGEALDLWLAEFGLASHAESRDLGRRGMSLSVIPRDGERAIDLTSVGVGVSQVMPVILLCLLARPHSVVLLEQPELHLHPAMQLKLADFFLACRKTGLQIILETHSEHLVNRLRRRVAEDDSGSLRHEIGLLFAEQENGRSRYRATSINENGALSGSWPSGFLDVGTDEAGEFLRGALRRSSRVVPESADSDE